MGKRRLSWEESLKRERYDIGKVMFWLTKKLNLDDVKDSTLTQQREQDIDLIATRKKRIIPIEVKIRYKEYPDFLIETFSNTTTKSAGWIYATKAELLAYVILTKNDVSKGYIMNINELRKWWIGTGRFEGFPQKLGKTGDLYETMNHAVPWKRIPLEAFIYAPNYDAIREYFEDYD